jgi:HicA toxin of bacterial toxin-antitoxin,
MDLRYIGNLAAGTCLRFLVLTVLYTGTTVVQFTSVERRQPMSKHQKTLEAVFAEPTKATIEWRAVEAMFKHLGAEITSGSGSRVRVNLHGVRAVFHRPHPQKEASKGAVESAREFLVNAGVVP